MSLAATYSAKAHELLVHAEKKNAPVIARLAPVIGANLAAGGILHTFGSGHSDVIAREIIGRPFIAPPGLPPERAKALRDAFIATLKDPAFLEEADKLKLDVNPVSGIEIDKLVRELYATPKDVVEETRVAIKP